MPSRKSNASSDATLSSDSRRTSLRRLSSIASLQNLFSRRRSHHSTDHHAAVSSSSDLSASSSTVDTTLKVSLGSQPNLQNHEQDDLGELPTAPPPTHSNNRRSSYICLPDDPIGGMPRSRTFSNLPVPIRAKKIPSVAPHSHVRLPSAGWPSTRLPSPVGSTRKYSGPGVPPARMKRSDTEPLLGLEAGYSAASFPRPTAFKENISLSPIKPLPALDIGYQQKHTYSSSPLHSSHYQLPGSWNSSSSDIDMFSSSIPSTASYSPEPPPPISKYASHPAIQMVRDYKSSPARPLYRSSKERPPTPGTSSLTSAPQRAPAQRWNSQPVLTARQNNHEHPPRKDSKPYKEIKQTRLMSARQAPTPQPPKTPMATAGNAAGSKLKGANNSASTSHVRESSEQTPTQSQLHKTPMTGLGQVTGYEPTAYWAGRLSALVDRYRNEELAAFLLPSSDSAQSNKSSTTLTPKAQTDKMHTPEASTARLKRAFEELNSRCATQEAREGLFAFQTQFAGSMNLPELRPPKLVLHLGNPDRFDGGVGSDDASAGGISEGRKASFMDRLLGRQGKRRSLVMA